MSAPSSPTQSVAQALQGLYDYAIEALPWLGKMAAILLLGIVCTWLARRIMHGLVTRIALDARLKRAGVDAKLERLQINATGSTLLVRLSGWVTLAITLYIMAKEAGFKAVSLALGQLGAFAPRLLVAALIMLGGLFLAELIERVLMRALKARDELDDPTILARVANVTTIILAMALAAEQLALELSLIHALIIIATSGALLALSATLALAALPILKQRFTRFYLMRTFSVGDHLRVGELHGTLIQFGDVVMVLEERGQQHLLPYDWALRQRIQRSPRP